MADVTLGPGVSASSADRVARAFSHPIPLSMSITRGPLPDEELDAIAATYGNLDPRYASREFCRLVFNENPLGYSFHAFVRDGDRVVGHYAVIPMRTRARGATVVSGKGEGLFIAESHRRSAIATPEGEVPTAIALMEAVHDHALAEGVAVIHNITTPQVGMLTRMLGFHVLTVWRDQIQFVITPPSHRTYRSWGARLLSFAQHALLATARAGLLLTAAPAVEVNSPGHTDRHLSALAGMDPGSGVATWSISRDPDTLRWLSRVGRLRIVSVAGRPDHFAIMTTGNSRELLLWNVPDGALRSGLAVACALLVGSVQEGAQSVSTTPQLAGAGGRSLGFVLRMLAFLPRRVSVVIYAKSTDPFYLQAANVDFSRIFNL